MGTTPDDIPQASPSKSPQDYLSQSMGLYNQAVAGFAPPAALTDYTNQMLNQNQASGYGTGLAGSSVQAANEASATAQAYDKYQQQYMQDLYAPAKTQASLDYQYQALNTGIDQQNAAVKAAASPWGPIADIAGTAVGTGISMLPYFLMG